ncbi:unnamed protein product [Schistosoma curassoni]|uniref:Uncharacterized protein n=1 Tax=Schistosoma curassoni TaxID=6186 RepID=A0A3P8C5V8_9TREM|nr:unnamed protein product [Schistosoma curassoni]
MKTIVDFIFLSFCLSLPSSLCVDTHKQQQRVAVFNRSLSLCACILCITRSSFYYQLSRRKKIISARVLLLIPYVKYSIFLCIFTLFSFGSIFFLD